MRLLTDLGHKLPTDRTPPRITPIALVPRLRCWVAPGALLILLLADPGLAADGVLEISQACAAIGCFPGDAAGFPVTIDRDQPGSYRLTGNLINLDPDVSAIRILDDHVTLDLNGFAVSGPTVCTGIGTSITCLPTGLGYGIEPASPTGTTGVVVRHGVVRGFPLDGIRLPGSGARVEGILAVGNGGHGVVVGSGGVVADCRVVRNGSHGIFVFRHGLIRRNVAFGHRRGGHLGRARYPSLGRRPS